MVSLVLFVALGHCILALLAMREKSTTADELAHITGGYTFNHWNDYRMHPENGLLPQRWQALPVTIEGAWYPNLRSLHWQKSNVWMVGHAFFYELGNNPDWMLFTARAMNTIFGAATVLLVAAWARYFYGWAGAITAILFCALCPTMLAHSALATSDMAMAFFLLAAASAYWWHLHDPRTRILALSLVTFGLACVAKYTAVLLLPLLCLMALIRSAQATPLLIFGRTFRTPASRLIATAVSTLGHGLAAVFLIWAFCGFRYSAFNPSLPPGSFNTSWEYALSFGGWQARVIELCRTWHVLPEAYLYGFSFVLRFAGARGAFLDGDYSIFGWTSFFPKTFLYKTPLSLVLAIVTSGLLLLLWIRQNSWAQFRNQLYRAAPLWLVFILYWGVSLTSHLNIGHRHILPTYPVLYIFCGTLGWAAVRAANRSPVSGAAFAAIILGLLGWQAKVASGIYPDYLAYFSPIIGGPAEGYKHLADSSLDWGQDLPGLQRWLLAHQKPGEPAYLSYFGTSEPDYYGIKVTRMPMIHEFDRTRPWYWFKPGIYALSATMLQHVYMANRGIWTLENERQYRELRRNDASFRLLKAEPEGHPELTREISSAQWKTAWNIYEELRFARLCHYLRARRPDAMVGYSILVFRLSQKEIDAATTGSAGELGASIERAVAGQSP
jgi:4-amino-4-deoxy-L-arabinose transferase-like glycosyltransferase